MCNCGGRARNRTVRAGGEVKGYYVILPDGTEKPAVSQGEAPFSSPFEAKVEIRRNNGGTMYTLKSA